MIYFLTKAKKTYTFLSFIITWGNKLGKIATFLPIEKFVRSEYLLPGVYILTDYDLLSIKQIELLNLIYKELKKLPSHYKLLNAPFTSLNRIELLNKLYHHKVNEFRCFSSNQMPNNIHFPVFARKGKNHFGIMKDLIYSDDDLKKIIESVLSKGYQGNEILITEFVDTSDENQIYRKYSAFLVDEVIIPRHIFFSKKWMIKGAKLSESFMINEELEYLRTNPHQDELKKIFSLGGINYGRIDYSISNGKIVVWEINSNPMIASSSSLKKPQRKSSHELFTLNFTSAFENIEKPEDCNPISNPLFKDHTNDLKEIRRVFPFNAILYQISNLFQKFKFSTLFKFYTIRNNIKNT